MKKKVLLIILLLIISILYLSFPVIIQPDSIGYYNYLDIFYGISPLSSWNVLRGPTLPTILFLITKLLGNNQKGILLGTYLFFMIFIIIYLKVINDALKNASKKRKLIVIMLTLLLILFNPVLYGYFRTLMTEFVAIPIILINCLLCYKWIQSDKWIKYSIIFSIISIFLWFLKQQYLIITLSSIFISLIISCFYKNWKIMLKKITTVFIVIIMVFSSITLWKNFLEKNDVNYEDGQNSSFYLSRSILIGNKNFRIYHEKESLTINDIQNDIYISNSDKEKLINIINGQINENFEIFSIYDEYNNIKYKDILYYDNPKITVFEALKFNINTIIHEPIVSFKAYLANYLATINLYQSERNGYGDYVPEPRLGYFNHENYYSALHHLESDNNFLWMTKDIEKTVENLKVKNNASPILKKTIQKISVIGLDSFKILGLVLPLLFIYNLFTTFKSLKNKKPNKYGNIATILFGTCFIYMLFLSYTGAIIDRYAYVLYPEMVLGVSFMILKSNNKKVKINKQNVNKNNKILFIIPAYNESENIEKVLNEIKTDIKNADILVINDCSKDNTKEIVEKNKVKCITNIFNMGYAMAVQTGIKYAYENDYDFLIQIDADGQHIAKEIIKMLNKQKETDCDIVIGSRYLVNTGYPCPFFRRIGTKFFSFLIKLFCGQKIYDPLSGLQLLNRNVIEYYSQMGNYPEFPDANLIMEMLYKGYKIEEVSVKMRLRENGESMHGGIIKPIKYMIKIFYTICFIVIKNIDRKGDD